MKRLVMVLAILAMAGAATLGVMNMKTLKEEQRLLAEAKDGIREAKGEHGKVDDQLVTAKEDRRTAKDQRDETSAALSVMNNTVARQESEVMGLKRSLEEAQVKKKEIDLLVEEVGGAQSFEELQKNVQAQKDTLANRQNEKASVSAELSAKMEEVATVTGQVQALQVQRLEHARNVALNGLEATVIATNRDWGFVMINVGSSLGVTAESSLLVKRGGQRIGRLRITDISEETLMAEVVEGSMAEGDRIAPGDKVIFEKTK